MADHPSQEGNPCLHTNAKTVRNNGVSRILAINSSMHDHQPPQSPHYSLINVNFGELLIIAREQENSNMADHRPEEGNPCLHMNANTVRNNGVSRISVIASAMHDHQPPQRPHYSLIDVNFGEMLIILYLMKGLS
ncbi:hypothetical protein Ancab_038578 [Ancistrocladus abbreviatus]